MKIVLATGIYPPEIGGPATYARALAEQLVLQKNDVEVVTYARELKMENGKWKIHTVSNTFPIIRWFQYAKKLKEVGRDVDVVYAFSSVSCGVPLILSGLRKPKKVLRLGGDFFWERYTAMRGQKGLREWYTSSSYQLSVIGWVLRQFDHIVFSTEFQQEIYEKAYKRLPNHSVIENALALESQQPKTDNRIPHTPFRLLFMGRFVGFKNLPMLVEAVAQIPDCYLTLVGQGPKNHALRLLVERLGIATRVQFVAPVSGKEKQEIFDSHDLLVLPSLTEISPNTTLEASACGLPVLLTQENGLSESLLSGMETADLTSSGQIVTAITDAREGYEGMVKKSASHEGRSWQKVTSDHIELFGIL